MTRYIFKRKRLDQVNSTDEIEEKLSELTDRLNKLKRSNPVFLIVGLSSSAPLIFHLFRILILAGLSSGSIIFNKKNHVEFTMIIVISFSLAWIIYLFLRKKILKYRIHRLTEKQKEFTPPS